MRNLYLIIVLLFAFLPGISAQTKFLDQTEIYLGTSQGVTGSMMLFDPQVKQNVLLGYNGGITFRYIAEAHKGFQVELNFSQRGWTEKDGLYARQLNYIELPFLSHFYWGDRGRFILNLGPKISYLVSENVLFNRTENSKAAQHTQKVQNPFDYGITLGIGGQFSVKRQTFLLEARANYSLSSIFANKNRDGFRFSNNMNVAVNLGWLMRIK